MTEIASNTPKPSDIFRALERAEVEGSITHQGQSLLDGARQQGLWSPAPERGVKEQVGEYASTAYNAVKAAWTGEGRQVEFTDAKEISDIPDVGFLESFWPNIKAGLTTNETEKTKIFAKSFAEDERFGGAGSDKFGNPYLVWNGEPFYVNRPGASMTDASDVVAQITQLLPAAKYAGGSLSVAGRVSRGLPAYAATNAAQQTGTMASGGRETVDLSEAGQAGIIGAVAEAVVPPMVKLAGRAVKPLLPSTVDDIARLPQKLGRIPMTRGQRSGDINLIRREEAMRQGAEGETASHIMRGFDERQMDAIGSEAQALEGRIGAGVGNNPSSATDIGSRIKDDLAQAVQSSRQGVRSAYKSAEKTNAALTVDSARAMADEIGRVPREMNIFTTEGMAQLNAVQKKLKNFKVLAKKGKLKPANIQMIERFRQGLNTAIKGTQGTEQAALMRMKGTLDRHMSDAIDQGLLMGDQEAVALLRNARELRALHAKRFDAGKGDRTGNAMLKVLDDNGATPVQTINYIVNTGKAGGQDVALGMVRRLKDIFGAESEQLRLVKSAYLLNAFTKPDQGLRTINRSSIVSNARTMIDGDGKAIAAELFSPDERTAIRNLVNEVAPTITPADARNPSRSAFAFIKGMIDRGLIVSAGSATRHLPLVDGVGNVIRNTSSSMAAANLTSQLPHLTSVPLISAGSATIGQQAYNEKASAR